MKPVEAFDFLYGSTMKKYKSTKFKDSTKINRLNNIIANTLDDKEAYVFKQVAMYGFMTYRAALMNSMDKRYVDSTFRRAVRKLRTPKNFIKATGVKLFAHTGREITGNMVGTRVKNILNKQGITTDDDLRAWAATSASALFNIPGIGVQSIPRLLVICEPSLY